MKSSLRIGALNALITPLAEGDSQRVQLLPAGTFRAADGRPTDAPCWILGSSQAANVIADAAVRTNDFMLDYEHQTINAEKNGQPNPAAGWFKQLEFDPEQGLFATDVRWTDRAQAMIDAKEYRYVSALFLYDMQGNVVRLINAALTNTPALDGMDELLAAASLICLQETNQMDENLRLALCSLLGLAQDADEAAIAQALTLAQEKVFKPAACSSLTDLIALKDQRIAALSQQNGKTGGDPDPTKYTPNTVVDDLRTQLAALSEKVTATEAEGLIEAALSDGRIIAGADEDWMRQLAKKDIELFKAGLSVRKPNPALIGLQTGGKEPAAVLSTAALSTDQKNLLNAMGLPEDHLTEEGGKA